MIGKEKLNIKVADSLLKRLKGLMGKSAIDYGMYFPNCNAIHTFGMKSAIDVIGVDEKMIVIYKYENLPKNRILRIKNKQKNTSILELPPHASKKIKLGSELFFEREDVI